MPWGNVYRKISCGLAIYKKWKGASVIERRYSTEYNDKLSEAYI